MTQIALLALFACAALSSPAHAGGEKDASLARIDTACVKVVEEVSAHPAAVCACVKRNYLMGAWSAEDLDLMARSYEQDSKAEAELSGRKYESLVLFDYDNTEGCLKNPKFRFKK